MDLDFAFLADAADVSLGKLFVLGGAFDTIHVSSLPAIHPALAVVLRLLLGPMDLDRTITRLHAIHPAYDVEKLETMKALKLAGLPPIRVVHCGDHYMAIEGSQPQDTSQGEHKPGAGSLAHAQVPWEGAEWKEPPP